MNTHPTHWRTTTIITLIALNCLAYTLISIIQLHSLTGNQGALWIALLTLHTSLLTAIIALTITIRILKH